MGGEIRRASGRWVADGVDVPLTGRELEVLIVLAERAGDVVPRAELYRMVWGGAMPYRDRSVDVVVKRIRQKLAHAAPHVAYVHTRYGVGYRYSPQPRDPFPNRPSPDVSQGGQVE